jgi:hypothetical protein
VASPGAPNTRVNVLSSGAPVVKDKPDNRGHGRDKPGHDNIEKWFKMTGNRS